MDFTSSNMRKGTKEICNRRLSTGSDRANRVNLVCEEYYKNKLKFLVSCLFLT